MMEGDDQPSFFNSMLRSSTSSQAKKAKHSSHPAHSGISFDSLHVLKSGWHEQDALRRKADGLQMRDWRPVHELTPIPEYDAGSSETDEQVVPDVMTTATRRPLVMASAPATPLAARRLSPTRLPSPLSRQAAKLG